MISQTDHDFALRISATVKELGEDNVVQPECDLSSPDQELGRRPITVVSAQTHIYRSSRYGVSVSWRREGVQFG